MPEILSLLVTEHALMMEQLWENAESDSTQLSPKHKKELNERLTQYRSGETAFYTWDALKNELNTTTS